MRNKEKDVNKVLAGLRGEITKKNKEISRLQDIIIDKTFDVEEKEAMVSFYENKNLIERIEIFNGKNHCKDFCHSEFLRCTRLRLSVTFHPQVVLRRRQPTCQCRQRRDAAAAARDDQASRQQGRVPPKPSFQPRRDSNRAPRRQEAADEEESQVG